jgi:N-acyl homoserine lactone hydrolase
VQSGASALSGASGSSDIRVLREGHIIRDGARIVDASSTVTSIDSGEALIIVDTGAPSGVGELTDALAKANISPEEVDLLINTHLHMDHCGCNHLFVNARCYAHRLEDPPVGTLSAEEGTVLDEGVMVIETPGHTKGSVSVLVRSDADYLVCGDALPTKANYETMSPPAVHMDRRLAISSMERIIDLADIVVPGHDAPFRVMGKK